MELGNLQNLKVLTLQSCTLRRINGGTVGMMKGLQELNLIDIQCAFHNFRRVMADIGELSSLEILKFCSHQLKDVLEGIKLPKSLKVLYTISCFDNLSVLLDLEEFTIDKNERTMELLISPAGKLKSMWLYSMNRIVMVEGQNTMLPSSLTILEIHHLQSDRIPNLKNLSNLTELSLWVCPYLEEVQGLGWLKSLHILLMVNMEKLVHIEGLGNLMSCSNCKLTEVAIVRCPLLRAFQTFEQHDDPVRIESLLSRNIEGCPLMDSRSIPRLSKFPRLRKLSIGEIGSNINDESGSQQDQLLEGLDNLGELVELKVRHLGKVDRLPSLSKLSKLTTLTVADLPCLREIVGLGELKSLQVFIVSGCISLERLTIEVLPYSNMESIKLDLRGCTNFTNVDSDLSPLTTGGADLGGKLDVTIKWPEEDMR
ncbi:Disease resistance protein L6 [Linum grandiflorum]